MIEDTPHLACSQSAGALFDYPLGECHQVSNNFCKIRISTLLVFQRCIISRELPIMTSDPGVTATGLVAATTMGSSQWCQPSVDGGTMHRPPYFTGPVHSG